MKTTSGGVFPYISLVIDQAQGLTAVHGYTSSNQSLVYSDQGRAIGFDTKGEGGVDSVYDMFRADNATDKWRGLV